MKKTEYEIQFLLDDFNKWWITSDQNRLEKTLSDKKKWVRMVNKGKGGIKYRIVRITEEVIYPKKRGAKK